MANFGFQVQDIFFIKYSSWLSSLDLIKAKYADWSDLYLKAIVTSVNYDKETASFCVPCLLKNYSKDFSYFTNNFVKSTLPNGKRILSLKERVMEEGLLRILDSL